MNRHGPIRIPRTPEQEEADAALAAKFHDKAAYQAAGVARKTNSAEAREAMLRHKHMAAALRRHKRPILATSMTPEEFANA